MRLARKKAAQVQLQAEVGTDDEWAKLLERDGLIVVDVYSEWCGPCIGMVGNLKKLKVEMGGDNLHLAIAKSDGIECLKRFRNKSEPTWMFIVGGMVMRVAFGADAPRLSRLVAAELARAVQEPLSCQGTPPDQLAPEEQEIAAAENARVDEIKSREAAWSREQDEMRRRRRADQLAPFVKDSLPLLLWPHAARAIRKLADPLEPYGITVADKYNVTITGDDYDKLFYENDEFLSNNKAREVIAQKAGVAVLFRKPPDKEGDIIDIAYRVLVEDRFRSDGSQTGTASAGSDAMEAPAGDSIHELLAAPAQEGEPPVPGFFCPRDDLERAAAIDVLFTKMICQLVESPSPATPAHVAVAYNAFKRRDVLALCTRRPEHVLAVGFFNSDDPDASTNLAITPEQYEALPNKDYDDPDASTNLAITPEQYEALPNKDYGDALVVKLSNRRDSVVLEFLSLGATRTSADVLRGAEECSRLFPPGYGAPPPSKRDKHAKRRKGKKKTEIGKETESVSASGEGEACVETVDGCSVIEGADGAGAAGGVSTDADADRADSEDADDAEAGDIEENGDLDADDCPEGEDKATSPMPEVN